jgi:hypothetical protein
MGLAIANLVADPEQRGLNDFLVAHELLHTVGASDLYDRRTGRPRYPEGYVQPDREPRYPQPGAELMAGRIPIAPEESVLPETLDQTTMGPVTAREIGWAPE